MTMKLSISLRADLISTWLQPGGRNRVCDQTVSTVWSSGRKPLKRFRLLAAFDTRLKPGANESGQSPVSRQTPSPAGHFGEPQRGSVIQPRVGGAQRLLPWVANQHDLCPEGAPEPFIPSRHSAAPSGRMKSGCAVPRVALRATLGCIPLPRWGREATPPPRRSPRRLNTPTPARWPAPRPSPRPRTCGPSCGLPSAWRRLRGRIPGSSGGSCSSRRSSRSRPARCGACNGLIPVNNQFMHPRIGFWVALTSFVSALVATIVVICFSGPLVVRWLFIAVTIVACLVAIWQGFAAEKTQY